VRTDAAAAHATTRVKLLDFGLAKMLEPDSAGDAGLAVTRNSGWAMTPAFAAPEQLTGQPITTATDVYSLGVLLYLLLSGQHPAGAGLRSPADLIAAVVDNEAPRLSEAVADAKTHGDDTIAGNAASRGTTPVHLRQALHGDLETIVAKAMKKSPAERYPSVAALADDLRRMLEQRPISARPDTPSYRAAKFVRRNRIPVALTTAAIVALGAGLVGTVTQARRATWQAAVAETQRHRADQEARTARAQRDFALGQLSRAEAINDLTGFVLSESASRPTPLTAVDLLTKAESLVHRQPGVDESQVEMLLAIGGQYDAFHSPKAFGVLSAAYAQSRSVADLGVRARAACTFARALADSGEGARAERLLQDTLRALPDAPQFAPHRVQCHLAGSGIAMVRGQGGAAVERARTAEAVSRKAGLSSRFLDFMISNNLAAAYGQAGRPREALTAYADAARQLAALGRAETLAAGQLHLNWARLLFAIGRPLDALPKARRAFAVVNSNVGPPTSCPRIHLMLARCLGELHRWPEAAHHAAKANADAQHDGDEETITSARLLQASLSRQLGDDARAARLLVEVEPRVKQLSAPEDSNALAVMAGERSWLALVRGETDEALALADRAVTLDESVRPRSSRASSLVQRSRIALQLDRVEQAKIDALRALDLEQQAAGAGSGSGSGSASSGVGRAHLALGQALHAQGLYTEAREAFSAAVDRLTPTLGPDHPDTRLARQLASGETSTR
jgi:eukaryotic-like serine/threonine-protein kinase